MPVVKRGFLFKHFEKIICGVVGAALLLAVLYAVSRAGTLRKEASPEQVEEDLRRIAMGAEAASSPLEKTDYLPQIMDRLASVPPPRTMRPNVFYPPAAMSAGSITLAPDSEAVIKFKAPITPGTIRVTGDEDAVQILEHPVDGDYKAVRVRSRSKEGVALVVGETASGKQEYSVAVRQGVGRTAFPPTGVRVVDRQGSVTLELEPNAQNEEVEVVGYEIWRRDWGDPLGNYHKVAQAEPGARRGFRMPGGAPPGYRGGPPAGIRRGPFGPGTMPGRPGGPAGTAGREQEEAVTWEDRGVKPGESYSYRIRTVGANTYPKTSDFTDPVLVRVPRNVDFQFTRSSADKVGFDVAKLFPDGEVRKETFWVSVGQEIGGVSKDADTGEVLNFRTGLVMVDFHRAVLLPGVGVSDRVIYADQEGNLDFRLRAKTDSDLWKMLEAQADERRRRGPVVRPPGAPGGFRPPVRR